MGSWDHEAGGRLDPASVGLHHHGAHGDSWRERVHDPTTSSGRPARRPAPLGSGGGFGRAADGSSLHRTARRVRRYFASSRRIVATADGAAVFGVRFPSCPSVVPRPVVPFVGSAPLGGLGGGIGRVADGSRCIGRHVVVDGTSRRRDGSLRRRMWSLRCALRRALRRCREVAFVLGGRVLPSVGWRRGFRRRRLRMWRAS